MGIGAAVLGLALACLLGAGLACGGSRPAPKGEQALSGVAGELAAVVEPGDGALAWAGFRAAGGQVTPATAALDEELASALIRRGVALVPTDTLGGATWEGAETVPPRLWQDAPAERVLAGRLEAAGRWAYLRLFLVEAGTGRLLQQVTRRLAVRHLPSELAMAAGQGGMAAVGGVQVEVHRLGLREEGGIPRSLEISPRASLLAGDRLQLRFRVAQDCEAWVLLFVSTGERRQIFAAQPVYSGRWHYVPGEDAWVTLDQEGQVYTLYLVVARQLDREAMDPETGEAWRRTDELVRLGELDRYTGLEKLDQVLVEEAVVHGPASPPPLVLRDAAPVPVGAAESLLLPEGLTVESRPEVLSGEGGVIRALSFEVR
ncbi:MAG: hypothetical protein AB1505_33480 [Candidatus Latescibacterota bacterium]